MLNRLETFIIHCIVAGLLMLVAGCAPGSAGSGDGPTSAPQPGPTAAAASSNPSAVDAIPPLVAATGVFSISEIFGQWGSSTTDLRFVVNEQNLTLISRCISVEANGPWSAAQSSGLSIRTNAKIDQQGTLQAVEVILTKPSINQLSILVRGLDGNVLLLIPNAVQTGQADPGTCP